MTRIPYRNLPQLLLRAREELLCHFRPIITHFGLTEQQWRVLRAVHEMEQLEPREICRIFQILSPSLTGVLTRMEEVGLITRARVKEDHRRVMVRLTPKAQQLVAELQPIIVEQYKLIEQAFGPSLIRDLYEIMDRVVGVEREPVPHVKLPKRRKSQ